MKSILILAHKLWVLCLCFPKYFTLKFICHLLSMVKYIHFKVFRFCHLLFHNPIWFFVASISLLRSSKSFHSLSAYFLFTLEHRNRSCFQAVCCWFQPPSHLRFSSHWSSLRALPIIFLCWRRIALWTLLLLWDWILICSLEVYDNLTFITI